MTTRTIQDYKLYAQIQSQPEALQKVLDDQNPAILEAQALFRDAKRVFNVGLGTSTNAATAAAFMFRSMGKDAQAWSAMDFVIYPPNLQQGDLVISFTHTGRKQFPKRAIQLAGEQHNVPSIILTSSGNELTDIPVNAVVIHTTERETCPMFSVSHTVAMLYAARLCELSDLDSIPSAVEATLKLSEKLLELAKEWKSKTLVTALGAGPHETSAHEFSIKVVEASRRKVKSHAVEQFIHGLQIAMTTDEGFVFFAGPGLAFDRTFEVAQFVLDMGCAVAWVCPMPGPEGSIHIEIPAVTEMLAPIVECVVDQLIAGHWAGLENVDGDSFRKDDPIFLAAHTKINF